VCVFNATAKYSKRKGEKWSSFFARREGIRETGLKLHLLLKYVLYGGKWSASGPEPFSPGNVSLRRTQSQSKHFKEENNPVNLPEI